MSFGLVSAAYVAAAILFILSLGGLSGQESAKRAVWYGIAGMALAVGATVFGPGIGNYAVIAAMLVIGCISKPVAVPTATAPAAINGSDQYQSRSMPVLILSTVVSVTSSTLGSRLKAISGTHIPARIESTSRLRISPRNGSR